MATMQLDEFFDYKNKLMEELLTHEPIVRLISEDVEMSDAKGLAYTQVFPFEYIPQTIDNGKTFVCFDVDIDRPRDRSNKTYYIPIIYVWVFSHKSRLRLDEGGVRPDKLCAEIANVVNGSYDYGLGQTVLGSVRRFAPVTDYNGKVMTFYATDFNITFDPNRQIPENRKRG